MAGLIVACDALVAWCSDLLDQGYRGEMECIVAKIFGSEAQKEAAIELFMKTHGGRSFLHGHLFGDNVHEYLAPCIYEGEGEMLGMAFFKSLVKHHGTKFFEPIGKALQKAGIRSPNPMNPAHLWALKGVMPPYAMWVLKQWIPGGRMSLPPMSSRLQKHCEFAASKLQDSSNEVSATMRKHQLRLADRQVRMSELSARIQAMIVMLCTGLYAARQEDEVVRDAADVVCRDLRRLWTGDRISDRDIRATTKLGEKILDGGFQTLAGIEAEEILMGY